jgi:hypothetical protein
MVMANLCGYGFTFCALAAFTAFTRFSKNACSRGHPHQWGRLYGPPRLQQACVDASSRPARRLQQSQPCFEDYFSEAAATKAPSPGASARMEGDVMPRNGLLEHGRKPPVNS